jgi:hypothetical protein
MFAGRPIKPCTPTPRPLLLRLPPLPPSRLQAVAPSRGYGGRPGRTLHAARMTLSDVSRQLLVALLEALGSGSIFSSPSISGGGLRAGWFEVKGRTTVLHGYSYVPGVSLSGRITGSRVSVTVGGSAASPGELHSAGGRVLVGTLGGRRVRLLPAAAGTTAASSGAAAAGAQTLGTLPRALHPLAQALAQLPDGAAALAELPHLLADRWISGRWTPR